ncbi:Dynactin Arp1 p62 subunit RO2 [Rasamsonia emersonii CBS 393.64]|uniref:Dynactin subunit 4 n=1 Tax=Rasamsonia emersonii (strain ATCC 16479 / CBS 393.64 / IMI 116815) TaxID=1408163 RepID=A0A0F4YHE0_RASE3|nr:Dynactin Arp1 p62 subunit RO2 [Rasamsonia emersonii CBS 393.64]KKA17677.1 Dynactin Arp1 p62 subunit RO2 [Rasamsonia emersonii CBS 393.64]
MSRPFPYTYISCPCAETRVTEPAAKRASRDLSSKKTSPGQPDEERRREEQQDLDEEDDEEEQTFDPRSPRANFSLYPPEQLLYCEDCHQIKCPRCITEEIVCWYCPNCLFETPSSMVRSEGNRCARNCFNCPICTAPLAVTTLENTTENAAQQGPWILACGYCMWTTLDIGIKFHKPTNICAQLAKFYEESGATAGPDLKSPLSSFTSAKLDSPVWEEEQKEQDTASNSQIPEEEEGQSTLDPNSRFAALKRFYQKQIEETSVSATDPLGTDFGAAFSSPSALNRIMSLYTSSSLSGLYGGGAKKAKSKPPVMREALTAAEGLKIASPESERAIIEKMASEDCGWDGMLSMEQRAFQSPDARFVEDLRPLPVLLRTKRSKRCKSCKHILVKPEFKPASTRFRIRLIALSYIPLPTLRPLVPTPPSPSPYPGQTTPGISTTTTPQPPPPPPPPNLDALPPNRPIQYLLTLKNHMFRPRARDTSHTIPNPGSSSVQSDDPLSTIRPRREQRRLGRSITSPSCTSTQ